VRGAGEAAGVVAVVGMVLVYWGWP
jgi:hypothetical protein